MFFPRKYVTTLLIFIILQVNNLKEVNATITTATANGFECREETFEDNCNSLDLDREEYYYLYYNGKFVNGMKYPLANQTHSHPKEYIQCFGKPHMRVFVRLCQCTNGIFDPILQKCRPAEQQFDLRQQALD